MHEELKSLLQKAFRSVLIVILILTQPAVVWATELLIQGQTAAASSGGTSFDSMITRATPPSPPPAQEVARALSPGQSLNAPTERLSTPAQSLNTPTSLNTQLQTPISTPTARALSTTPPTLPPVPFLPIGNLPPVQVGVQSVAPPQAPVRTENSPQHPQGGAPVAQEAKAADTQAMAAGTDKKGDSPTKELDKKEGQKDMSEAKGKEKTGTSTTEIDKKEEAQKQHKDKLEDKKLAATQDKDTPKERADVKVVDKNTDARPVDIKGPADLPGDAKIQDQGRPLPEMGGGKKFTPFAGAPPIGLLVTEFASANVSFVLTNFQNFQALAFPGGFPPPPPGGLPLPPPGGFPPPPPGAPPPPPPPEACNGNFACRGLLINGECICADGVPCTGAGGCAGTMAGGNTCLCDGGDGGGGDGGGGGAPPPDGGGGGAPPEFPLLTETSVPAALTQPISIGKTVALGDWGIWTQLIGSYAHQRFRKGVEGFRSKNVGFGIGVDKKCDAHRTVGIGFVYNNSLVKPKNSPYSRTKADSYIMNIYHMYAGTHGVYAYTALNVGAHQFDVSRNALPAGFAKSAYRSYQIGADASIGKNFQPVKSLEVTPSWAVRGTLIKQKPYLETGGESFVYTQGTISHLCQTNGNVKVSYQHTFENAVSFSPYISSGWGYDFNPKPTATSTTSTTGTTIVQGPKQPRTYGEMGTGIQIRGREFDFGLDYSTQFKSKFRSHSLAAKLTYKF